MANRGNKKFFTRAFPLITIISLCIAGCGSGTTNVSDNSTKNAGTSQQQGVSTSTSSSNVVHLSVSEAHYPSSVYGLPFEVGIAQGIFDKHGIHIDKVVSSSGGGTDLRNVVQGNLAFGDISLSSILQASQQNNDPGVVIIAGNQQTIWDWHWIQRNNTSYSSLKDVANKPIAITQPGSSSQGVLALALQNEGIDPKKVNMIAAGETANQLTLLKNGQVDAALLTDPKYTIDLSKKEWKPFFDPATVVPNYAATVLVTSKKTMQENPKLVRNMVDAWVESMEWISSHPSEAGSIFSKNGDFPEDTVSTMIEKFISKGQYSYKIEPKSFQAVVKSSQLLGILKPGKKIEWENLVNQEYLPESDRVDLSQLGQPE